jgi:hypothetical protein
MTAVIASRGRGSDRNGVRVDEAAGIPARELGAGDRWSLAQPTWSEPGVTRRIGSPVAAVAHRIEGDLGLQAVRLGSLGELRMDHHQIWADPSCASTVWRASGRLIGAGPRLARFTRIDIEVRAASSGTAELRLVPRSRHIHRWAARRHRRYFRLAHAAGDHLKQLLGP